MPAPPPRLSIVIPSHDTRELTVRCLAALATGGSVHREVVVVDDGSHDHTCEALRTLTGGDTTADPLSPGLGPLRVLRHEAAVGFSRAVNHGVAITSGEILLLLNADTEVDPGALDRLVAAFDADPRLGIAGATLRYPDGSAQWSGGREPTLAWLFALASQLPALLAALPGYRRLRPVGGGGAVDWVTGAALAVRRTTWQAAGPLDERFAFYAQDLALCLAARRHGWRVTLLPEVGVMHHHGASIGQQTAASGGQRGSQHLARLWSDLLRWADDRHGRAWAQRASRLLRLGGRVRQAGRLLRRPFVASGARAAYRRDDLALAAALAAITPGGGHGRLVAAVVTAALAGAAWRC